jgi:hypothetical protein
MKTILSGANPGSELMALTRKNHEAQAEKWGYNYRCCDFPEGQRAWPKLGFIIEELLQGNDVFWIDSDAVFTTNLPPFSEDNQPMETIYLSQDINGPCAGVMFIPATKPALGFFWAARAHRADFGDHPWSDQAALRYFMLYEPYRSIVKSDPDLSRIPYDHYPEYPKPLWEGQEWTEKSYIMHCPGLPLEKRIELLSPFCQ